MAGFMDAAGTGTNMVGVRIQEEKNLKLYRKGQNPVLRGLANIRSPRSAHLGPRLDTTHSNLPGREVPNPLIIEISKGEADIDVVVKDILSLTKLNYNTCIFGDGMPITLKFADAVGEILTAGPIKEFLRCLLGTISEVSQPPGMFSPHFLQRIVKSQCRVGGRLNTNDSIGEEKENIQCRFLLVRLVRGETEVHKCNHHNSLERSILISWR